NGEPAAALPVSSLLTPHSSPLTERRAELDAKQDRVAALLGEVGAEGLLLLDPANIAWLTGAPLTANIPDPADWPALYLTATARWLVSASTDTQRLFDQHLDGLGFQLKEWPWNWGRDRLLADLRQNRRVASDRLLPETVPLGPTLRRLRCTLTPAEQARYRALGAALAHALEATCRNLEPGQTEEEVAGQLAHRLLHHGIQPVALAVAADGRVARHPRPGVTTAAVRSSCLIGAVAARAGLHVTAGRTVFLAPPDDGFRKQYDAACRIMATLAAAGGPGTGAAPVLQAAERVARLSSHDDAWRAGPAGHVTGWLPVERPLPPGNPLVLEADWAVTWRAGVGAALCADTFLVAGSPACVTPPEPGLWPVKRVKVLEMTVDVPDLLVRAGG
ncbi:MAG TPA: M24 family metallopeptidase, partial [Gemmataceae bacterium]